MDMDIPIKNGTVRWLSYGGGMTIEVELVVHPTVVNFINTSGFFIERVTITSESHTEMSGLFTIHTGTSSILLTSDINEVEGVEKFTPMPASKSTFLSHSDEEISISNEFKSKQKSSLSTFLTALLDSEIKDKGNREFIYTLVEKLKKGQPLNPFDQYLLDEIGYLMEESIKDSQHPSSYSYTF
jgi:hypothetical protein